MFYVITTLLDTIRHLQDGSIENIRHAQIFKIDSKTKIYSYIGLKSLISRIFFIIVLALYSSMHAARIVEIIIDGNTSMYCSLAVHIMKGHYTIIYFFLFDNL
jgi:hypothetical protein